MENNGFEKIRKLKQKTTYKMFGDTIEQKLKESFKGKTNEIYEQINDVILTLQELAFELKDDNKILCYKAVLDARGSNLYELFTNIESKEELESTINDLVNKFKEMLLHEITETVSVTSEYLENIRSDVLDLNEEMSYFPENYYSDF